MDGRIVNIADDAPNTLYHMLVPSASRPSLQTITEQPMVGPC